MRQEDSWTASPDFDSDGRPPQREGIPVFPAERGTCYQAVFGAAFPSLGELPGHRHGWCLQEAGEEDAGISFGPAPSDVPPTRLSGASQVPPRRFPARAGASAPCGSLMRPAERAPSGGTLPLPPAGPPASSGASARGRRPSAWGKQTLLVRHIPARYTQDQLVEEWQLLGQIDLFFLPFSCKRNQTLGYAVINFTSHQGAASFLDRWQGGSLAHSRRSRPLEVFAARVQGFWPSLEHIARSSARAPLRREHLPLVFSGRTRCDVQPLMLESLTRGSPRQTFQ
mmetsp:Transcript_9490/g.28584  ORF Transcript_9490/g.28584 Transcript_9490/m.28584 type:complete len:283 (+) Transcript_9490:90-938(+)